MISIKLVINDNTECDNNYGRSVGPWLFGELGDEEFEVMQKRRSLCRGWGGSKAGFICTYVDQNLPQAMELKIK